MYVCMYVLTSMYVRMYVRTYVRMYVCMYMVVCMAWGRGGQHKNKTKSQFRDSGSESTYKANSHPGRVALI